MPLGMFYDLIACTEIIHGAEEAKPEAKAKKAGEQRAEDSENPYAEILKLK